MLDPEAPTRPTVVDTESDVSNHASKKSSPHTVTRPSFTPPRTFAPDASLVLVGIRGCGKRSLGFVAATALKRRFVTEDHYFREITGVTRQEYLKRNGSQEFQRRDIEVLKMMLENHRTGCVMECGLASLTRPVQDHLRRYAQTNPVVHLLRDIDSIQQLLGLEDQAMRLFREGDPMHRTCSNFEFYNLEDRTRASDDGSPDRRSTEYSFKLQEVKEDFTRFVQFITGLEVDYSNYDSPFVLLETPPELRSFTHAILVRSSDLMADNVVLAELESGGDAIELRVDRWSSDMAATVSKQVSVLRRNARTPVILSVDSSDSGADPNRSITSSSRVYFDILEHGLRLGVEYLVVDMTQDRSRLAGIIEGRGNTKIIAQQAFEPSSPIAWDSEDCITVYQEAEKLGCQLVRLLRVATKREENAAVMEFSNKIRSMPGNHPPLIAYNVGALGRTSQVFNTTLAAVTHPAITTSTENKHDPQITSRDAVRALFQSYMLDPLKFYIIGENVAYSLSPAMHNAAFQHCGMGHTYSIPDLPSLAVLDRLGRDPHFGGSSVVQPWRVEVYQKLASKSRHAEAIGAINTIMPLRGDAEGRMYSLQEQASRRNQAGRVLGWYGENTDWVGIMTCIRRHLSPRNAISAKTTGLVIGAGGMARAAIYAMLRLGCRRIFIYNRTRTRAEEVARHFNSWASSQVDSVEVVRVLGSLQDDWPADAAQPSLVASCVPADPDRDEPPANFEMPVQWLGSPTGGVILELAYKPLDTPLLRQMRRVRSQTGRPWVLSDGLENVTEQGIAQFELMTARKAPRRLMAYEVLRNYVGENGRFDEKTIQARLDGVAPQ
ncbi:Shikimate kinase [Penicillium sp. DV-2018c]|nr:Shikimate kinase [Penicillium sp. DV-2018c]KAJ5583732.1 Shikimate kinase [Penicillium sp. DV-2018c]